MNAQILTLSSKGQISLPISIRRNLNIDTGDKLAVYTSGDVVMLKVFEYSCAAEPPVRDDESHRSGPLEPFLVI